MEHFLKLVAKDLLFKYPKNFSELCIVFPNRRGMLFFNKYLSEIIDKPIWQSENLTISQLFTQNTSLLIADKLKLVAILFKHYKVATKSTENFDEFYFWGEMLLSDFDTIDKYLVNAKQLFQNVKDLKEIENYFENLEGEDLKLIREFWENVSNGKKNKYKDNFIATWEVLFDIYTNFKTELLEKGIAYEGLIYRDVAENIKNLDLKFNKIVFIGFNALNSCEISIFKFFKEKEKALFYWDYDKHYVDIKQHEAGFFIRDFLKIFPPETDFSTNNIFSSPEKKLDIVAVQSNVGQLKYIEQYIESNNIPCTEDTAVLLANEDLMIPLLNSLPKQVNRVNITMGYPFVSSNSFAFIKHYLELQKNVKVKEGKSFFYYKEFVNLLRHRFIANSNNQEIINKIITNNLIYIGEDFINTNFNNFEKQLFAHPTSTLNFIENFKELITELYTIISDIDIEFLYFFEKELNCLYEIIVEDKIEINIKTFIILLKKKTVSISIPFAGEPLIGLQIMGVLESRALDFENVIIVSTNEGVFPQVKPSPSFIPTNLRAGFGLPTINHQDSIFAYYFYRVLQRSKNICIIYNSDNQGGNNGEESRFIKQLVYETKLNITKTNLNFSNHSELKQEIDIEKTDSIILKLEKVFCEKGVSASSLNTYISCPLKFYFKYIEGISEPNKINEDLDYQLFGNVFHKAAELIYSDFINKLNLKSEIEFKLKDKKYIEKKVDDAFETVVFKNASKKDNYITGKHLIIKKIIIKSLVKLLDIDKEVPNLEIITLEKQFKKKYYVSNIQKNIYINGFIDRIEKRDGEYYLLDYKTGKCNYEYTEIDELFDGSKDHKKDIFQTLLYCLTNHDEYKNCQPSIYGLKEFYSKKFKFKVSKKNEDGNDLNEFAGRFDELISEILDKDVIFSQTENTKVCEYCEFKEICE